MAVRVNGSMRFTADAAIGNIPPHEKAAISEGRKVRRPSNMSASVPAWYDDCRTMLGEPTANDIKLGDVMAALADPVRVAILLELTARGESACGTFELGVSKATRSHHFKVLREA